MPLSTFTLEVDAETGQAYRAMSSGERKKIQLLLRMRAGELAVEEPPTLDEVMEEVGRKARARGLTPEILDSILRGE